MRCPAQISHHCPDTGATVALGRRFGEGAAPGTNLALCGDLGAGKTHFVKGLAAGLGCPAPVTSPTFSILHEYAGGRLPVFHFDFYRLASPGEVLGVGWDEYLDAGGVVVVEWAEKFPLLLPAETRWLWFQHGPGGSRVVTEGLGPEVGR
jgi:tRNA threonylcarbamoyladenosine biosynthesis protein TsaE